MDITKSLNDTFLDTNYIKSKAVDVKNTITDTTVKATESIKKTFLQINDKTIIFGLLIVILISIIVAYGLYYLISVKLFYNIKNKVVETSTPIYGNVLTTIPVKFDNTSNGLRRSYMFWIYINDLNKGVNQYKHVLHVGDNTGSDIRLQSPYIFLDKLENKLIVYISSTDSTIFAQVGTGSSASNMPIPSLNNLSGSNLNFILRRSIIIPYIPLQRWVHIGLVINESSSGIGITAYVDGDISNYSQSGDLLTTTKLNVSDEASVYFTATNVDRLKKIDYSNANLNKDGNLVIGGNQSPDYGFNGLISKFVTTNYDLNQRDIYNNYNEGPVNNLLLSLGIPNYGVRNPIYRIDDTNTSVTSSVF